MKYNDLIAHYHAVLLGEKDAASSGIGFNGISKLGRTDTKHMNVTTDKDKNVFRPYNDTPRNLSNPANQALKKIDAMKPGTSQFIPNEMAVEILAVYNRGSVERLGEGQPKKLNSKSRISIFKKDGRVYLQKN